MHEQMNILFAPHPPILLGEVGRGREKEAAATLSGMAKLASIAAQEAPETIIYITPHGNMFRSAVCILNEESLSGDFSDFGAQSVRFEKQVDIELTNEITGQIAGAGLPCMRLGHAEAARYGVRASLDHGCMVPMYFIDKKYPGYRIVHITPGALPHRDLYAVGAAIARAVHALGRKTLILSSGDLAHSFEREGPPPQGSPYAVFDAAIADAMKRADVPAIVDMPSSVYEPAQQCGLNSFCIALGALDSHGIRTEVFSCESPFGVGYMCAHAEACGRRESYLEKWRDGSTAKRKGAAGKVDEYIRLARAAVETFVRSGENLDWSAYKRNVSASFISRVENEKAGAFVSLHEGGELRGCIGTISATQHDLAHEIINSAIEAASEDPRFEPVSEYELADLDVKVDILHPAEKVQGVSGLDAQKYGVIVESGRRRGLLLPALEGVDTPEQQIVIARRKAGISPDESVDLFRFEVERHEAK